MRRGRYERRAPGAGGQEHTASGGLTVAPVLHHLTARLPEVPKRCLTALASEAIAAGQEVVTVGADVTVCLDVLLGWERVSDLPGTTVPHPDGFILGCLNDGAALRYPAHMSNQVSGDCVLMHTLARLNVPEAHGVVTGTSAQPRPIWTDGQPVDHQLMATELLDGLVPLVEVPHHNTLVSRRTEDPGAARKTLHLGNLSVVTLE